MKARKLSQPFEPIPVVEAETRVLMISFEWLGKHPDLTISEADLRRLTEQVELENLTRTQIVELLPGMAAPKAKKGGRK